jgi:pimeloyl-ACP methyl ester carboxylesterase
VIIAGASQGGQAALFAASLAPRYTPELKVRGTVALAPYSHLGEQLPLVAALKAPNPISTFAMFFTRGLELARPSLHVRAGLSETANARYGQLDRRCVDEVKPGPFDDIAPADLFKPGTNFADDIRALEQLTDPENLTIRTPVRIDHGTADTRTFPVFSEQTVAAYRARGTRVTYKVHEGVSHTGVLKAAADEATAWISRRLRRRPSDRP